jgi:hypothetical protein
MSLESRENTGSLPTRPESLQLDHQGLPASFQVRLSAKGAVADAPIVQDIAATLTKPEILDALSVITGESACAVIIEGKQGLREPVVSFPKPGHLSIVVAIKTKASGGEAKRIERAITEAVFVSLAFTVAQHGVQQGRVLPSHQKLLHTITGIHAGVESQCLPNHGVGEQLSTLLREPQKTRSEKRPKQATNPHRDELSLRLKRLLSQLRDRPDCSTPEKAQKTAQSILTRIAGAKVVAEFIDDYKECERVANTAIGALCGALRDQFAHRLVLNKHGECEAFLEVFKGIHAELARGGFSRPVPVLLAKTTLKAPIPRGSLLLGTAKQQLSEAMSVSASDSDIFSVTGMPSRSGPQVRILGDVYAGSLTEEIRELSTLLALNRELQLEQAEKQSDFIDQIIVLQTLAPGVAHTLLAIREGDDTADPTELEELLKAALACRHDPEGDGIWYHDLLLGGHDIPPPDRRNPEANAIARAKTLLSTLRFLHAWQNPQDTSRAELLKEHESFVGLFVVACARAAIFVYEGQCGLALQGGNDRFVEWADLVFDDLSALEANFPYMMQCVYPSALAPKVRALLQEAVTTVRQAVTSLVQLNLDDGELLSQASTFVAPSVNGPLKSALQQANKKLLERVQQYARGLTSEAEQVLEQLFQQESAAGLIEHSKKLLDVVRLDPSKNEHKALVETVDSKVRGFIKVVDEGYGDEIRCILNKVKGAASKTVSGADAGAQAADVLTVSEVESGLQALSLIVRELRLIRDGLSEYKDILTAPLQAGSAASPVRLATIGELAALLMDRHTSTLSRALGSQPEILQYVREKLQRDLASKDAQVRAGAEQVRDGVSFLRGRGK